MVYGLILFFLAVACSEKPQPLSIQVLPARLASDARGPQYVDWDTVRFSGGTRTKAATYMVAPEPLFTEWNIIAFKAASQNDSSYVITARLNAHAKRKMQDFSAEPTRLKDPLGLKIGDRWVNFLPLLSPFRDRIQLYGFSSEEVELLQHDLANR